jgi:hypothetical protein
MQINIPNKMQDVADEIAMFTGLRREEVDYRLRMEKLDQGWNVRQDYCPTFLTYSGRHDRLKKTHNWALAHSEKQITQSF